MEERTFVIGTEELKTLISQGMVRSSMWIFKFPQVVTSINIGESIHKPGAMN